jgi:hypothetical protein
LVLEIERGKHRDRPYKGIAKLMHSVPEPIDEEHRSTVGLEEEPAEESRPKTPEALARLLKQKEERKEEPAVATLVEKVLVENWERTEVGGELWQQCVKTGNVCRRTQKRLRHVEIGIWTREQPIIGN